MKCEERVYSGASQYFRISGTPCTREATVTLHAKYGGSDKKVCNQHAKKLVKEGNYERA